MNPKNTWLLVFVAAGLFAFIYFVERKIVPPPPVNPRVLAGLDTNTLSVIEISPKGMLPIRLERSNDVWQMTRPVVYPVETYSVNSFLRALAELTPRYRITAKELQGHKDINAEYGFDKPGYTILAQQGDNTFQLYLGNFTAPGDEIYAQVVGREGVDVIGKDFLGVLPADANEWRDKVFARFNDPNIDRLTVTNAGGASLKFQRETNELWSMTEPIHSPADTTAINMLLEQTRKALVTRFLPDNPPPDLAAAGLQPPLVEIDLADGTNPVAALQFGRTTGDGRDIYARAGPQAPVVTVMGDQLSRWRLGQNAFRERYLISLHDPPGTLQRGFSIEVTGAAGRSNFAVRFTTNATPYIVDSNLATYPGDPRMISQFLGQLFSLQVAQAYTNPAFFAVKDIVPTNALADYGLAESNLVRRYTLNLAPFGGPVSVAAQLDFGLPNTNYDNTMYVRRGHVQDDAVYAVTNADFQRLPSRALDLRDRHVWTNFAAEDVRILTVSWQGRVLSLERHGAADWVPVNSQGITNPDKEVSTEGVVENLLGGLQAYRWVGPVDKELSELGLGFSDQSLKIDLTFKDGGAKRIEFGGPVNPANSQGEHYAAVTLEGQRWIFTFSPRDWSDLTNRLWLP